MAYPIELQDPEKVAATIRRLHQQVQQLHQSLARLEFRADALLQEFAELAKFICSDFEHGLATKSGSSNTSLASDDTFLLELAAKSGVDKVEFEWMANGKAQVSINGGSPFQLSPAIAHLLEVLCEDTGTIDDAFVAWKTRAQVEVALAGRMGTTFKRQAVHTQLYRLRRILTQHGENPFLIRTQRNKGIRFALRRKN